MNKRNFNVRVYGIWVNEDREVLVTDEYRFDTFMTKFPGGGLQHGEGTIQCLKREWKEELDVEIEIQGHFYTTDFFQRSAFDDSQVISIYYEVEPLTMSAIDLKTKPFDFDQTIERAQTFRTIAIGDFKEEDLTFPIDRKVAKMLTSKYHNHKIE